MLFSTASHSSFDSLGGLPVHREVSGFAPVFRPVRFRMNRLLVCDFASNSDLALLVSDTGMVSDISGSRSDLAVLASIFPSILL